MLGVLAHWYRLLRQRRHGIVSADMYVSGLIVATFGPGVVFVAVALALLVGAVVVSRAQVIPLLIKLARLLSGTFPGQPAGCLMLILGGVALVVAAQLRLMDLTALNLGIVVLGYLLLTLSEPLRSDFSGPGVVPQEPIKSSLRP